MKINSIKQGTIWSLLSQAIELTLGLYLLTFVARFLGPENYGLYQTIVSLLIITSLISDVGISQSSSRYIATYISSINEINKLITSGILLKVMFLLPILIFFYCFFSSLEQLFGVELKNYKFSILLLITLRSFKEYLLRTFQGIRRLDLRAKYNMIYTINFSFLSTVFLLIGLGVYGILIAESIALIILLITGFFVLKKRLGIGLSEISKRHVKSVLQYAIPMMFISLSFYIYTKSDILILQYFLNSEIVGLYALATMIIAKVHVPLVAIGQSAAPAFASLKCTERGHLFKRIFNTTSLLALPMSVGLFLVSDVLVWSVFGEDYNETILVLKVLCFYLFWYCLNTVTSPILDYMGYAKIRSVTIVILASINILLNFYLIPRHGLIGPAYSTLITYTIYSVLIHFIAFKVCFRNQVRNVVDVAFYMLKISWCTLVMVLSIYVISLLIPNLAILRLIILVFTGVISYVLMVLLMNVVKISDVKEIVGRYKKY